MPELRLGVWHSQSPHPDWNEEQWWPEVVSSYAIELGDDCDARRCRPAPPSAA